jgi:hypothetical protein
MTTERVTSTQLESSAAHVCYNIPHTSMAVVDHSGAISTWQRDGQSREWIPGPAWTSEGLAITCICWAPPEYGNILCAGTGQGIVLVWAQDPNGNWNERAHIPTSTHSALYACFAPRQMGPIVSLAFADGSVKLFIASAPLNALSWDPHSAIQLDREVQACTSLSWREFDPVLPPLLALGTEAGGAAEIWMFREQLLRWEQVHQLNSSQNSMDDNNTNQQSISAVAWAPRLGRPYDIIAIASGSRVVLWSLVGAVDSFEVERMAVLDHDHDVWQLGWNMLGNWLAASTEGGEVCMWRPDLSGEWLLLNKIII